MRLNYAPIQYLSVIHYSAEHKAETPSGGFRYNCDSGTLGLRKCYLEAWGVWALQC